MTVHDLKTWPVPFDSVWDGTKSFEIRKNDRDFHVGDVARLYEWQSPGEYTGRLVIGTITFITAGASDPAEANPWEMAIDPDYVVFCFRRRESFGDWADAESIHYPK